MDDTAAIGLMSALAQPTRLRGAALLASMHPDGLPAGELARRVQTPQNTMSSHLGVLARAGAVVASRNGRIVEYRADPAALASYVAALAADAGG